MPSLRPEPLAPPTLPSAPELAPLLADWFEQAPAPQRVSLLNGLLRPVGPLALVAVAAGAFASLLPAAHWHVASVSLTDAMRVTAGQVLELARYVEQKSPDVLQAVLAWRARAG